MKIKLIIIYVYYNTPKLVPNYILFKSDLPDDATTGSIIGQLQRKFASFFCQQNVNDNRIIIAIFH